MNKELFFGAGNVFTPNTPVRAVDLFAGREEQIFSLLRAISGSGSHAIIFGERGVGKTSLAQVASSFLPENSPIKVITVGCDGDMSYSKLMSNVLDSLYIEFPKQSIGYVHNDQSETTMLSNYIADRNNISSQEVRRVISMLRMPVIIIIDEVDRLSKETTRTLADTIKTFSDNNVLARLVLVGIGDSVGALIEGHQSVERALVQIHMPRMSNPEITEVIEKGITKLGITLERDVQHKIVSLSRGLPHYTHQLMFHATQSAAEHDRLIITEEDFRNAITLSVKEKEQSLKDSYLTATRSTKRAFLFPYVLLACALAETDPEGLFALKDVQKPLEELRGEKMVPAQFIQHIGSFSSEERGMILEKIGRERKFRYRFMNPLMQSYVIMKALSDGLKTARPIEELL